MKEKKVEVLIIPAFQDNYIFLLAHWKNQEAIVIDPGDAAATAAALKEHGLKLKEIWITHHHWDHTGGVHLLKKEYNCLVFGPKKEASKIPSIDKKLLGGEHLSCFGLEVEVLSTPGHTHGHIAYHLPEVHLLFCGDTLFSLGCGRIFEGTPKELLQSLQKIAALPEGTWIYCTHEYTRKNLSFAKELLPQSTFLKEFELAIKEKECTLPSQLGQEKKLNPFLRAKDKEIKQALDLPGSSELEVFTKLRQLRDQF